MSCDVADTAIVLVDMIKESAHMSICNSEKMFQVSTIPQ